jgi:gas vesicle protein
MNKIGGGSNMNKVTLLIVALVFGLTTAVSAQVPVDKAPTAEKKTVKETVKQDVQDMKKDASKMKEAVKKEVKEQVAEGKESVKEVKKAVKGEVKKVKKVAVRDAPAAISGAIIAI